MTGAPPSVTIRPAQPQEQRLIRRMVRRARLDPTTLKWQNFLMAEKDGKVIGCGQVKPYPGCRELGSLVVLEAYRRQAIGGALIRALLADEEGAVYLMCRDRLVPYYERFGFHEIGLCEAPGVIRLKLGAGRVLGGLFGIRLAAMRRPHEG